MASKLIVALLAAFMTVVGAYGIWYHQSHPREIVRTGSVAIEKKGDGDAIKTSARTRTVRVGAVILNEVELPGGSWIDCARDCVTAYRESTSQFWEAQTRSGR